MAEIPVEPRHPTTPAAWALFYSLFFSFFFSRSENRYSSRTRPAQFLPACRRLRRLIGEKINDSRLISCARRAAASPADHKILSLEKLDIPDKRRKGRMLGAAFTRGTLPCPPGGAASPPWWG
ncbi:hypothetical protein ES703_52049 [subsurface metagenome]